MHATDRIRNPAPPALPLSLLQIPAWKQYPWLRHGFSTRHGGVSTAYGTPTALNLGHTPDDTPANVNHNRAILIAAADPNGTPAPRLVTLRQVHSNLSLVFDPAADLDAPNADTPPEADGLLTARPNLLLAIQTADCVPVLVADPRLRVVAAFHAGWRGTVLGIVERGVASLIAHYGSRPEDLIAAIGPAIGPCCYTVGAEVRDRFHAAFPDADSLFKKDSLDLAEANRRQLQSAGLPADRIAHLAQCTACTRELAAQGGEAPRRFFSHRAEAGRTGRMLNLIGIAAESPAPAKHLTPNT